MTKRELLKIYEEMNSKNLKVLCKILYEDDKIALEPKESILFHLEENIKNGNFKMCEYLAKALQEESKSDFYKYNTALGTPETPTPINTIEELLKLL